MYWCGGPAEFCTGACENPVQEAEPARELTIIFLPGLGAITINRHIAHSLV